MHRIVTIAREYGSGGLLIARRLAERLGWKVLDRELVERIAQAARVDPSLAASFDERVDPWLHRLSKQALWQGAFEGVSAIDTTEFFDAEAAARMTRKLLLQAAEIGNCVIVGRGSQCALAAHPDAFHVFVYAPAAERHKRLVERGVAAADVDRVMQETDAQRAGYLRLHYQQEWHNPHLYHLLVNASMGDKTAVETILTAMGREPERRAVAG